MNKEIRKCKNKNKREYRTEFYIDRENLGCPHCSLWDDEQEMGTGRVCEDCLDIYEKEGMSEKGVFITPAKTWMHD